MERTQSKNPWSDDQIQSTPARPPDAAPWTLTLAVIAMLGLLLAVGYLLWRISDEGGEPASAPASAPAIQKDAPLRVLAAA